MTDLRSAIEYLVASGAAPISVIETRAGRALRLGIAPPLIYWITPETDAKAIIRRARRRLGKNTDRAKVEAALGQAAAELHVTVMPHAHAVAMMAAAEVEVRDGLLAGSRPSQFEAVFSADHS